MKEIQTICAHNRHRYPREECLPMFRGVLTFWVFVKNNHNTCDGQWVTYVKVAEIIRKKLV